MERLRRHFAEVETDEVSDKLMKTIDLNGDEDNFSDHEIFIKHDTESEEGTDSGNKEVNSLTTILSKDDMQWKKTQFE
ncbi:hypothetical protein CEXT_237921 [Caerostris extrusa]|uniref:Uncharacterized protein n=1 Tax=Caerostris extrusa TaxID=172846 RepID=A0AAV4QBW6_CAEEX|nr:hypothetical protein CEXT_237921 [Caerostris extrusa]